MKTKPPQPAPKNPLPTFVPQSTKRRSGKPPLQGASPFFKIDIYFPPWSGKESEGLKALQKY